MANDTDNTYVKNGIRYIAAPLHIRVVLTDGKSRRLMLSKPDDGKSMFVNGLEIDKEGNEIERKNEKGQMAMQRHLIQRALVKRIVPQRWNLSYGELEDDK